MIRALIVDDEVRARQRLIRLLSAFPEMEVAGEAGNGREALEGIASLSPDVVFLDIEMPLMNGLEVAGSLPPGSTRVIFATAYDEYALKAFDAHAIDYLLKPVEPERLRQALAKLEQMKPLDVAACRQIGTDSRAHLPMTRIGIKVGDHYVICNLSKVSAFIAAGDYVEVIYEERRLLSELSLDALSQMLPPDAFLRIHRSAILNLAFVKELVREGDRRYQAILSDHFETRLPISRENLPRVKQALAIP